MSISPDTQKHMESVAETTLATFETISTAARSSLSEPPPAPERVLMSVNTFTSRNAVGALERILNENRMSLRSLLDEPAIARVVATNDDGERRTYFVCRTSPVSMPTNAPQLASYRSPVGRLASLPVGEEIQLNGESLEVVERALLRPVQNEQGWDSRNSVLESETYSAVTVESLRALLSHVSSEEIDEELLERLLREEVESASVVEGIRRTVLTRMALRDQPVLDRFQDSIFRLPLDSRLLLLGPPGTGKTTTLIRRLGQKLDMEFLTEDEQELLQNLNVSSDVSHDSSWLMFTPTTLLQQYVKESFSREGVPASDRHVRTWTDYRRELARNVLGLLRTTTRRGGFVLREPVDYLLDDARRDLTGWFDDFESWQQSAFLDRLRSAAEQLTSLGEENFSELGEALLVLLESDGPIDMVRIFGALRSRSEEARRLAAELKSEIDNATHRALVLQVNRDKGFLDQLAMFLDTLEEGPERQADEGDPRDEGDGDEDDEEDGDEDAEEAIPRTGRRGARIAYRRAIRQQARAEASGRPLRKGSRAGRIVEWIGDRGLEQAERVRVGRSVLLRTRVRPFVNPVKAYMDRIATRYRAYRRARQSEDRWYLKDAVRQTDIHPLELDMLLLAILRGAKELMAETEVRHNLQEPFWSALGKVHASYRNQVFADEATDFSPVQLACMSALSHPIAHSFFACGDFNQRVTAWGTRSESEMAWADAGIGVEKVTIGYRQSRELNEFARQVVRASGGGEHDVVLPDYADRAEVPPVLAENISGDADAGEWLAKRVTEIESSLGQLPSIAVLVPEESQVAPVATALNEALLDRNINVVACPNGQVIGQDNDIRVFDAQHIKGLEFEAVFFKDVDRLAAIYPELFDKFLYVGATRAATYLGLTCSGTLPESISDLRSLFASGWGG